MPTELRRGRTMGFRDVICSAAGRNRQARGLCIAALIAVAGCRTAAPPPATPGPTPERTSPPVRADTAVRPPAPPPAVAPAPVTAAPPQVEPSRGLPPIKPVSGAPIQVSV